MNYILSELNIYGEVTVYTFADITSVKQYVTAILWSDPELVAFSIQNTGTHATIVV